MFAKFENSISDNFEKFSHWWQKLTGKDCFWLAKASIALSALSIWLVPIGFGNYFPDFKEQYFSVNVTTFLLGLMLISFSISSIKKIENVVRSFLQRGLANPLKVVLFAARLILDFLVLIVFYFSLVLIGIDENDNLFVFFACIFCYFLFFACGVYFVSCNPLPPGKSKVREWIDGMSFLIKQKKQFEA